MPSKRMIALAFRQLASMMDLENLLEHLEDQTGLKAYFSGLPWDEKVFKIDGHGDASADASSGDWMARISKDGPCLTLSPTVDINARTEIISGHRFWRQLTATIQSEYNAAHLDGRRRPAAAPAETLTGHRWDQRHFLNWTRRPARDGRPTEHATPTHRQLYALYYQ